MDSTFAANLQSTEQLLPAGSSRQVVRAELRRRAFRNITERVNGSRADRRELARRISSDMYKAGERLSK